MPKTYKLSPSDFAFLWQECKRCFYLKIVEGFKRPAMPFPSIFGVIDTEMRKHFLGQRTERLSPDLPPGTMAYGEKWVQSELITRPGRAATVYVKGKLDAVVQFDDHSYGVIDFKTSDIKATHVQLYSRQLRAYAYALEHPGGTLLALSPVSALGLLSFTPDSVSSEAASRSLLSGSLRWHPVQPNPEGFLAFVDEILAVLDLPEAPPPDPKCVWCKYRADSRENGL
jgi:hypothetical protein